MENAARAIIAFVVLLVVIGLILFGHHGGSSVDWSKYPDWKQQIDQLAADHECEGLQTRFNFAEKQYADADLMDYINGKMKSAGCFAP